MAWPITADVGRFDEAVDWFLKRVVMTGAEGRKLDADLQQQAFWIGGGLQHDQVQRVFDKIAGAIERGDTFDAFRKAVRSELEDEAHTETVFRNATQRAYNAGRYDEMTEPSVLEFRPFWMYDAILDGRTTPICQSLNGTVLAADDPWWDTHYPPLHHRCRSSIRNLRRAEAERRGTKQPDVVEVPQGWGASPKIASTPWKPSASKSDPQLVNALERKQRTASPRQPRPPKEHRPEFWEKKYSEKYGEAARAVAWGRAANERGLDMPLADVERELEKLSFLDHVGSQLGQVRQLRHQNGDAATLRASGGEVDPSLRAIASTAGHLKALTPRGSIQIPDLVRESAGRRAISFFERMTSKDVSQPAAWTFQKVKGRAWCTASQRRIEWNESVGVLEHEWAHALEALNPKLAARAEAFLKARTGNEPLRKLRSIFPEAGYGDHEVTREDEFIHPYVGSWYQGPYGLFGTELTSMGTELLVAGARGWGTLTQLAREDPEMLWFTLGQLAHR